MKTKPSAFLMDRQTFQRLRRVMLTIGGLYNAGHLPTGLYEDIQRLIVWMDNEAGRARGATDKRM